MENGCKTCFQQKYAIYDLKQNVPTEGPKNVSLDMTIKNFVEQFT